MDVDVDMDVDVYGDGDVGRLSPDRPMTESRQLDRSNTRFDMKKAALLSGIARTVLPPLRGASKLRAEDSHRKDS